MSSYPYITAIFWRKFTTETQRHGEKNKEKRRGFIKSVIAGSFDGFETNKFGNLRFDKTACIGGGGGDSFIAQASLFPA